MKKQTAILITALSLAIALGGILFGVSASHRKMAAEEEANRLRMQIARMQSFVPAPEKTAPAIQRAALANTNALAEPAAANPPPQRESREERIARMKQEDPEGYAEMVKRRAERRDAIRYDLAGRTASFMELDTAFMTGPERENHEKLIEKMAEVWALTEQFQDTEQPPNREAMRELFGAIGEARPLMDAERSTMFRQLANDLGYDGAEAQDFSGYVEDIISATTLQPPRRGSGNR